MPSWTDYYKWLGDVCITKPSSLAAVETEQFVTDTRLVKPGDFFVPLVGEKFDGHKFIENALEKGAIGFFYDKKFLGPLSKDALAKGTAVTDTLVAFQKIAQGYRNKLNNLELIAITGSNGKTTVKEILNKILMAAGSVFSTFGSFNNEIGVPKSLLQIKPHHKFAALEFGARKEFDIEFLVKMARPTIGAVLNVGAAHLEIFGSTATLLKTKTEMVTASPRDMIFIYPKEDQRIDIIAQTSGHPLLSFGLEDGDIRVTKNEFIENGKMHLAFSTPKGDLAITLGCCHETLAINCAAAIAMATAAGIDLSTIKQGLETFNGVPGRFQVSRLPTLTLIDDAYNANSQSMKAGLTTLKKTFSDEPLTLILGDMLEIGATSKQEHFAIGEFAANQLTPNRLIVVGPLSAEIAAGALKRGLDEDRIEHFADVDLLINNNNFLTNLSGTVYIKASNGTGLGRLVTKIKERG